MLPLAAGTLAAAMLTGCLIGGNEEPGGNNGSDTTWTGGIDTTMIDPATLTPEVFSPLPVPVDNPLTEEGVALGRMLFYDPILSGDSTQACATCHLQSFGFADPDRFSTGITSEVGDLNAPAIVNPAWGPLQFWNGRAPSLEAQALQPVPNPIEMNLSWEEAQERLNAHPEYPALFEKAFGAAEIDSNLVVKAIAQFERTFVSGNSKYDRWKRGEVDLTDAEFRGLQFFENEKKGDCFHCHLDPLFGDGIPRNNGVDSVVEGTGRGAVTGDPQDMGKWKSPTLRNVGVTAPYMHDGRFATLEEVLDHYNSGGHDSPTIDVLMLKRRRTYEESGRMTEQEMSDLIAFLHTLTDSSFLENPDFSNPFVN